MEQQPGQRIANYQVLKEVGRGTVSIVYRGNDPALDRPVAIKVLLPQYAADQDFVQLFLQRAQASAQLRHPYIVAVFDVGRQDGQVWMGMEYLDGIPLRDLIRLQGPMLAGEVAAIVRHLASGLDYVHRAGLFHGDVRSSNVIICPPGRPILTELGVVRSSFGGQVANDTVSAAVAPEQVTGDELGPWTDIYALGVLAYEMLAGRPPHAADSAAELLYQVAHEAPAPLTSVRPDLPAAIEPVLRQVLAQDPRARYGSGIDFAAALESALGEPQPISAQGLPAEPPASAETAPAATEPPPESQVASPTSGPAPSAAAADAAPPAPAGEPATPHGQAAVPITARTPPSMHPPDASLPPPWESVPIRATPPPQTAPTAARPAPKVTRLPSAVPPPSTPADRLARLRATPAGAPSPLEKPAEAAAGPRHTWLWLLLGVEALLLLMGIALIVLLMIGIL